MRSERGRNAAGTRLERVPEETWKCVLTLIKKHVLASENPDRMKPEQLVASLTLDKYE